MKVQDIPTPALLVDLPAMQRNIERMASFYAESSCKLRPHFKAHKTPEIARRQLAAGSCTGLTCATVGEAEVVASERLTDNVLIANQVLGPGKAARVANLARDIDITVAVDSESGLTDLSEAATAAGVEVGVLVDVNVGVRSGVMPGEPAVALARLAQGTDGIKLQGVMGYEGLVVGIEDREEREARDAKAMNKLLDTVRLIREAALPCDIVSAGGTGTFDITGRMEGITEIQAGSYVLMDTAYAKLDIPFEKAFSVLGTVVSRPRLDLCAADCGHKSVTQDHGNPDVKGIEGASVVFLADEHGILALPPDASLKPGDRIELWPSHIDPTINLHDVMYAVDGEDVVEVWPIAARGYPEQRVAAISTSRR